MSESPLLSLSSGAHSLLEFLSASPAPAMLAGAMALAFAFHRTQWLTLLWVLLLLRLGASDPNQVWPGLALGLAWLQALWRGDKPLRRPLSWIPAGLLTALVLAPRLPLPPTWLSPDLPALAPLGHSALSPLVLLLMFAGALSLLFRHYLSPTPSWPWHALGLGLSVGLCLAGEAAAEGLYLGLATVLTAAVLTDAYSVAYRDALTGIPNRRALTQTLKTLGRRYAIAMADVDHFKSFNDTWGHETGDQVLKLVARVLSDHGRSVGVYRYGGEEFTLVFRGMTKEQATPLLDELRERIAAYPLMLRRAGRGSNKAAKRLRGKTSSPAKTVRITASFGVSDHHSAAHPQQAIELADKALYKAKQAGRNCVKQA